MPISHRHIEVFRAIMATGSVTNAASFLHTSQPTISRELSRLEYLLGFKLFDRKKGRLHPSARALALFEEVQRSYVGLEQILSTANKLKQFHDAQLAIICVPAFSHSLLPAVCRRFLEQNPEASISVTPQDSPLLEEWLTAQRHDLGITEHDVAPPGTLLESLLVADEVCVLPTGHPLLEKRELTPKDFEQKRYISLAPSDPYRVQLDEVFQQHGVSRNMALETHSAISICEFVRAGLGIAIINPLTAATYNGMGVETRSFSESVPFRVSAVIPQHRPSTPLTPLFMQALRSETTAILKRLGSLMR